MVNRISICGVPKSGTKLIHHMIHAALPDWDYTPKERPFNAKPGKTEILTKMPSDLFRFDDIKEFDDIAGIIMCRDPLMVLTSKHRTDNYWVYADAIGNAQPAPKLWYKEILKQIDDDSCVVFYETLIHDPKFVQDEISSQFDIEWEDDFAEYINYSMPKGFQHLESVVRPLESRGLKIEDLPHLGKQLENDPELMEIRKELGYGNINLSQ